MLVSPDLSDKAGSLKRLSTGACLACPPLKTTSQPLTSLPSPSIIIIRGHFDLINKLKLPNSPTAMVRKRQTAASSEPEPSSPSSLKSEPASTMPSPSNMSMRSQWMFFAVASGACAAFNGVFAKL